MIKDGIIKHANVNAKFIASGKTIIIQAHVFVRLVSISNVLKILQWRVSWNCICCGYYQ